MVLAWIVPALLLALLWDRPSQREGSLPWIVVIAFLLVLPGLGVLGTMHDFGYDLPEWAWGGGWLLLLLATSISLCLALRPGQRQPEGVDILKLRLARGEITPEDFELLRQKLSS